MRERESAERARGRGTGIIRASGGGGERGTRERVRSGSTGVGNGERGAAARINSSRGLARSLNKNK